MKASKLVYNTTDFIQVSGKAQTGISFTINSKKKFFGLEEWNNNETIKKRKLVYIDSFRSRERNGDVDFILLFMFNPTNKNVYFVGCLKNVKQLTDDEIQGIRDDLGNQDWLNTVQNHFNQINDDGSGFKKYTKCWNSNSIVAETEKSFVLNVSYDELKFLEKLINLTEIYPEINNLKRLSVLYNLPNEIQELIF